MRITIVTLGTRGDVQPYVALGLGLQQAGHTVRIATHASFRTFVTTYGLDFAALPVDPQVIMADDLISARLGTLGNTVRTMLKTVETLAPVMQAMALDCLEACRGADVVLGSVLGAFLGYPVAARLAVPFYPAYFQNIIPTQAYPSMLAPTLPLGGLYNRLSYSLADQMAWRLIRRGLSAMCQEALGLPPLPHTFLLQKLWQQRQPHLIGFSPTVVPEVPEWGAWVHVTGYWFLARPENWQPPARLMDFIAAGPPPISVGFGSMAGDEEAATALVLKALALAKQRAVLITGWGGLSQAHLPDHVFGIEAIPFDWLFPRMAAVVHHGGAGTTATGLRAGVPNIVVPHFMDQPFWGMRVAQLGAGPRPIPRNQLTVARLAQAIRSAVSDDSQRAHAASLGRALQAEDGVAKAVEVFERYPARVSADYAAREPRFRLGSRQYL